MCGIIGCWSSKNEALPAIIDSLKRLEYRGYDSFGFAVFSDSVYIEKKVGRVSLFESDNYPGKIGIGHTRWATHGKVSERNAHPHSDCSGKIIVVHNGIIENYQDIKKTLHGHKFLSETDTEVIPHLIEERIREGYDFMQAVVYAGKMLKGRNSFIAVFSETKEMIAFRNGSPLIVGVKRDNGFLEIFIASDIQAFIHQTKKVMYLDDGQIVAISGIPIFYDVNNLDRLEKRLIEIDADKFEADKGDYSHFMIKEIMDQKETLARAINQDYFQIAHIAEEINNSKGVFFIGCGTASKVCHTAEYIFSEVANKHVNFVPASEFENYKNFLLPQTLVIAVSQSGETADVLEALKIAKGEGSKVISILNTSESSISKISDYTFFINAGPEKAVASTKATTSQIAVIILLAYACAGELRKGNRLLVDVAAEVNDMLNPRYSDHIKKVAEKISIKENILIIGRGVNYPLAMESAIKIMEVSYIHAQGFAGGELKHGPIALIEEGTPVIALVSEFMKDDLISNAIEVKSRGAQIIGISPENNEVFDYWIKTPNVPEVCSPIVNLIPVQLLAYYLGILRGHDVDYPRSLAKSVTVK